MAAIQREEEKVEFKPVRRVVIGHDPQGKAVALFDAALTAS